MAYDPRDKGKPMVDSGNPESRTPEESLDMQRRSFMPPWGQATEAMLEKRRLRHGGVPGYGRFITKKPTFPT